MTRSASRSVASGLLAALGAALAAAPLPGQDPNFDLPASEIERRLAHEPFQVVAMDDNRWEGDRTQRATLRFADGTTLGVKWARAAPGGFAINNQPRYEVAAYAFQKLFLDEPDWVVPPTVMRELGLDVYRQLDPELGPTFEDTRSVLVALQYWLPSVDYFDAPDPERVAADPGYERRLGHLNLLTYLIHHVDSNPGNVLISTGEEPRMFAVDNGVAFRSPESPRGTYWAELHVDRLPADAVARLRRLGRAELDSALAVVAQFRIGEDGRLEAVEPTPKMNANKGVDRQGSLVQFGLNSLELDELWARRESLLRRVDAGEVGLAPAPPAGDPEADPRPDRHPNLHF